MGLLDRAKKWLGLPPEEDEDDCAPAKPGAPKVDGKTADARERLLAQVRAKKGGERPALTEEPGASA